MSEKFKELARLAIDAGLPVPWETREVLGLESGERRRFEEWKAARAAEGK